MTGMTGGVPPRPAPGAPRDYRFPAVHRAVLANQLRVVVAPMPRLPLVTALLVVDAGASRDPQGRDGLAQLTAALLAEGTAELDGAALTERFERLGTSLSTGADWDAATLGVTVTPARLEEALRLLGDVVRAPAFEDRELERLKGERLSELFQQKAEPRGTANDAFLSMCYAPVSRYARPAGGIEATVQALFAEDAFAFHAGYYRPGCATLVLAGDVTVDGAMALAQRCLGEWTGGAMPPVYVDGTPRVPTRAARAVPRAHAAQSEIRIGHAGPARTIADYFPATVMNAILGGLFSSRINLNLRERHAYTYGAYSTFDWRRGHGPFVVSTAVQSDVTGAAVREILGEIDRMREAAPTAEELSLATAYLAGVFPIRYETTGAVAGALAGQVVHALSDDYFDTYRDKILQVTPADVLAAAQAHLHPEALQVLVHGDPVAAVGPLGDLGLEVELAPSAGDWREMPSP